MMPRRAINTIEVLCLSAGHLGFPYSLLLRE